MWFSHWWVGQSPVKVPGMYLQFPTQHPPGCLQTLSHTLLILFLLPVLMLGRGDKWIRAVSFISFSLLFNSWCLWRASTSRSVVAHFHATPRFWGESFITIVASVLSFPIPGATLLSLWNNWTATVVQMEGEQKSWCHQEEKKMKGSEDRLTSRGWELQPSPDATARKCHLKDSCYSVAFIFWALLSGFHENP